MITITSQQDAILAGLVGAMFLLLCSGGMILALRRGWFRTKFCDVEITKDENPIQFWLGMVAYLFGVLMGVYFVSLAIF